MTNHYAFHKSMIVICYGFKTLLGEELPIKTHYDTLKVTRDAPDEVIAAAYKALARIYHPDKTGNDPGSSAIMQSINVSYKILSDPQKKAEHDLWITAQERNVTANVSASGGVKPQAAAAAASGATSQTKADKAMAEAQKWTAWSDRAAQEAIEAQDRVDKALADLAKAKAADR